MAAASLVVLSDGQASATTSTWYYTPKIRVPAGTAGGGFTAPLEWQLSCPAGTSLANSLDYMHPGTAWDYDGRSTALVYVQGGVKDDDVAKNGMVWYLENDSTNAEVIRLKIACTGIPNSQDAATYSKYPNVQHDCGANTTSCSVAVGTDTKKNIPVEVSLAQNCDTTTTPTQTLTWSRTYNTTYTVTQGSQQGLTIGGDAGFTGTPSIPMKLGMSFQISQTISNSESWAWSQQSTATWSGTQPIPPRSIGYVTFNLEQHTIPATVTAKYPVSVYSDPPGTSTNNDSSTWPEQVTVTSYENHPTVTFHTRPMSDAEQIANCQDVRHSVPTVNSPNYQIQLATYYSPNSTYTDNYGLTDRVPGVESNYVLDVPYKSTADLVPIQTYPRNNPQTDNQEWSLIQPPNNPYPGDYEIKNSNSGKCLDVSGASTSPGAAVIQYTCKDGSDPTVTNQLWRLKDEGNYHEYDLVNENSKLALTEPPGSGCVETSTSFPSYGGQNLVQEPEWSTGRTTGDKLEDFSSGQYDQNGGEIGYPVTIPRTCQRWAFMPLSN